MRFSAATICLALLFFGCASEPEKKGPAPFVHTSSPYLIENMREDAENLAQRPEHEDKEVQVQHLLISFAGRETTATRTREEAENLASELYARAIKGEDFDQLVVKYTDDSAPGIYGMVADVKAEDTKANRYYRLHMVPAFGNVGWRLLPGEIGIAPFDRLKSPYGWHIIKRLK